MPRVYFQLHFSTAPEDYTSTETDLTFTPDDSNKMCVNIPIGNDTVVEGSENFTVTVTSNDTSVQIGPNSNSTVTIVDDDGENRNRILSCLVGTLFRAYAAWPLLHGHCVHVYFMWHCV